jgi:hypothetical protein
LHVVTQLCLGVTVLALTLSLLYPELNIFSQFSPHISLTSSLILSSHLRLGLPSVLCSSGCPTRIFYEFYIVSMLATFRSNRPSRNQLTIW